MSQLKRLSLETIYELAQGQLMERFQRELKRAVLDCDDRPTDKRGRKVTLQVTLFPVATITGKTVDCDGAKGTIQCRCKLPDYETEELDFGIQQSGDLIFNPDSPANHRQSTLLGEDD